MPRLAVLGHPVAHSRSPAMQNAALAALGLGEEWSYEAIDVAPDELRGDGCGSCPDEGFAGANVTVPHKGAALALADDARGDRARDRRRQHAELRRRARSAADNTDADGLLAALPELAARAAGAGARRRRRGPRGRLGAAAGGRRGRGLEPDRRCAPSDLCEELGGAPVERARARPTTT